MTPGGKPYPFPSTAPSRGFDDDRHGISSYGSYKTICVRLCDGYYFPISNATARKGFARDEARCQASCGNEGRLFHLPANQSTIEGAVDGDGRSYVAMRTAFLYRKKKIDSCQCRQAPWSETEQSRHRVYAEAEEASKARDLPASEKTKVAENSSTMPTDLAANSADIPVSSTERRPTAEPADARPVTRAEPPKRAASTPSKNARLATERSPTRSDQLYAKPPQGQGPVPVKLPLQAKAPALANPMGLGGGSLQWPGDAPPAQALPRKRY